MKTAAKIVRNGAGRRLVVAIGSFFFAAAYCHAAQRDESNGYTFTAAMEWRKAAELLIWIPAATELCWQHWERLMQLPRQLAGPGGPLYVRDAVGLPNGHQVQMSAPDGLIPSGEALCAA